MVYFHHRGSFLEWIRGQGVSSLLFFPNPPAAPWAPNFPPTPEILFCIGFKLAWRSVLFLFFFWPPFPHGAHCLWPRPRMDGLRGCVPSPAGRFRGDRDAPPPPATTTLDPLGDEAVAATAPGRAAIGPQTTAPIGVEKVRNSASVSDDPLARPGIVGWQEVGGAIPICLDGFTF